MIELREGKKTMTNKKTPKSPPKPKPKQAKKKKGRIGIYYLIRVIKTLIIFPQKKFAVWKHFGQLYQRLKY